MMPPIYEYELQHTAEAADMLSDIMQKECKTPSNCDYLLQSSSSSDGEVKCSHRMKMVDWCYWVIDKCQLNRETVALAMSIVDRFLSKPSTTRHYRQDLVKYQLLTITALYTAIKFHESEAFGIQEYAAATNGVHSKEEIEDMELTLLQGIEWRVYAPTSLHIATCILSLIMPHVPLEEPTRAFISDEVRFQTEYAVRDYYFSTKRSSTVAVAAIFNALDQVDRRVCEGFLRALILVLIENCASPRVLFAAKDRLKCLIENDECNDEGISMPGSCRKIDHNISTFDRQQETNRTSKSSPRRQSV